MYTVCQIMLVLVFSVFQAKVDTVFDSRDEIGTLIRLRQHHLDDIISY